jgi:hypothetical protein
MALVDVFHEACQAVETVCLILQHIILVFFRILIAKFFQLDLFTRVFKEWRRNFR